MIGGSNTASETDPTTTAKILHGVYTGPLMGGSQREAYLGWYAHQLIKMNIRATP